MKINIEIQLLSKLITQKNANVATITNPKAVN